jgi:hypothetical protein
MAICKHILSSLWIAAMLLTSCVQHKRPSRDVAALSACINNLRQIDGAKQQWALEKGKTTNDVPTWSDILAYLGQAHPAQPICPQGGTYTIGRVGDVPKCSLGGASHILPE